LLIVEAMPNTPSSQAVHAKYVPLHNRMKKNQNMLVWLSKMVLTQHFGECVEALVNDAANLCTCKRRV
jgi:hypothetical protein